MPKLPLAALACLLVLTGAGCSIGSYFGGDDYADDYDYDYDYGDYEYYEIPEGLEADVEAPLRASERESFQVVATVTNNSESEQLLHSIDIDSEYLEGVAVVSSEPVFDDNFLLDDGTITHFFEIPVAVGESVDVTFNMEAVATGDYGGDFDICFDDGGSCTYLQIRTIVE